MRLQISVCLRKMFAAEKATIGRQGRRMRRGQYQVTVAVDKRAFLLSVAAPQHKDQMLAFLIQLSDDFIGKRLPAKSRMRMRCTGTDSQYCVQQQYALFRPMLQIAVLRNLKALNIRRQLFININQRRWHRNFRLDGKRQTMRLTRAVIRVLPQYHYFYISEFCRPKGIEYIAFRRINGYPRLPFMANLLQNRLKIRLFFFRTNRLVPSLHYLLLRF